MQGSPVDFSTLEEYPLESGQQESTAAVDVGEQPVPSVQINEPEAVEPDTIVAHEEPSNETGLIVDPSTLQDPDIETDSPDPGSEAVVAALIESDVLDQAQAQDDIEQAEALGESVPTSQDAITEVMTLDAGCLLFDLNYSNRKVRLEAVIFRPARQTLPCTFQRER
jgi:hypothetical protein